MKGVLSNDKIQSFPYFTTSASHKVHAVSTLSSTHEYLLFWHTPCGLLYTYVGVTDHVTPDCLYGTSSTASLRYHSSSAVLTVHHANGPEDVLPFTTCIFRSKVMIIQNMYQRYRWSNTPRPHTSCSQTCAGGTSGTQYKDVHLHHLTWSNTLRTIFHITWSQLKPKARRFACAITRSGASRPSPWRFGQQWSVISASFPTSLLLYSSSGFSQTAHMHHHNLCCKTKRQGPCLAREVNRSLQ